MSVLHCLMMSHGGELMARYRGLLQSHHEYVVGLNDKLSFFDAAFVKSKAKGKESKKKIKSLTKSLGNLHAEVARLSANLNRATILEADKDEEILRLKATPLEFASFFRDQFQGLVWKFLAFDEFSRVQGELLSLAASVGFERGLSMRQTKEEFAAVLEKISQSVPGRREWANVMVDGPYHEMTDRAVDANLWNMFVQGASHAVDDDFKLTLIGSERVSSGPSDVVVALFVGGLFSVKGGGAWYAEEYLLLRAWDKLSVDVWLSIQRILGYATRPKPNGFPLGILVWLVKPRRFNGPNIAFKAKIVSSCLALSFLGY
nr:hypothetical protein [Tanacetum cinerariifolium]